MEILKYVLAVAVGSFLAGVGVIQFLDKKIEDKIAENPVPSVDLRSIEQKISLVEGKIPAAIDLNPINTKLLELQNKIPNPIDLTPIENRLRGLENKLINIEFGTEVPRSIGVSYMANTSGFVIAKISSSGSGHIQGIVCGYTEMSNPPKRLRSSAQMEYRNNVYMPMSSFIMPVKSGEYWVVKGCSGTVDNSTTDISWLPIETM